MPKFLNPVLETDVNRLPKENYSCKPIQKKLKEENIDASISSILRKIVKSCTSSYWLRIDPSLPSDWMKLVYLDDSNGQSKI